MAQVVGEGTIEHILQAFTVLTFIVCFASLRFDKTWSRFLYTLFGVWVLVIVIKTVFNIREMNVVMLALTFAFFSALLNPSQDRFFSLATSTATK